MVWMNGDGEINGADPWDNECDEDYIPNKLFYHSKILFKEITTETNKAYLLKINKKMELWIPKGICKNMTLNPKDYDSSFVYIHTKTYDKIVKRYKDGLDG